jgi:hypothetical protein
MKPTTQPDPHRPAPRQATREDNRRILDALDQHYDVDRQCYRASFTDEAVASQLDVPRAWVSVIRDQAFGPNVSEADQVLPGQLRDMVAELTATRDRLLGLAEEAERADGVAKAALAKAEARVKGAA